jgi:hypothetical protein
MERPFDYPGRHSEAVYRIQTRIGGFETHDEDGCGYTSYVLYQFTALADDAEIEEKLLELHPAQHCTHDYDCCGRTYPQRLTWSHVSRLDYGPDTQLVLVRQRWVQNV